MANRYWVGGTDSWNGTTGTKWATTSGGAGGAAVPTSADDVFFDAASGAVTCTLAAGRVAKSVNFTGFTGTFSMPSSVTLTVSGNVTFVTGMTVSISGSTGQIIFNATATLTSAGKTLNGITVNGSGITVTLADALTVSTINTTTLTAGTLNLNGFTLSTGNFSSSGSSTRAITFGSQNIAITSTAAATVVLDMATATGFTFTGTGGFTRNMAATATVRFGSTAGGTTSNAPNLTVNAGSSTLTIISGSYFKNVIFTGSTSTVTASGLNMAGNLTLASGGTYTAVVPTFRASGTVTSAGNTLGNTTINGSGITATLADALTLGANTLTLTEGTFTAANFNVTAGFFASNNSNTRTLNMGSGTWTISGSGATAWDTATTTGLTLNPSTSTVSMTSASAKTFAGGGLTYYNLNQGGTGALTISGSNTFNNITNTTQPATVTFTAGTTQTVSNFSLAGTAGNLVTINSTTPGAQFTLSDSSGTISPTYLSITDSYATGGATWDATGAGNVDGGNNTGWIFASGGGGKFLLLM